MTDVTINNETVNAEEFGARYAELVLTSGAQVAEDFAHEVLGDEPDADAVEALRPFVESAMEARKEEIMNKIVGEMNGTTGDIPAELSENVADGESTGENSESTETLSEATEEEQAGASTSGQDDRENA